MHIKFVMCIECNFEYALTFQIMVMILIFGIIMFAT